jgi:hypothetical protein
MLCVVALTVLGQLLPWDLRAVVKEHVALKDVYTFSAAVKELNTLQDSSSKGSFSNTAIRGAVPRRPSATSDRSTNTPRVALITAVVGQLPQHIGLLAQSCRHSPDAADCLIYYTEKGAHDHLLLPLASPNVHFKHITKVQFFTKLLKGMLRNEAKHKTVHEAPFLLCALPP